jgi:hypothetical protein
MNGNLKTTIGCGLLMAAGFAAGVALLIGWIF